jgi:hypothetical protein
LLASLDIVFENLYGGPQGFAVGLVMDSLSLPLRRFIKNMGPSFTLGSPLGPPLGLVVFMSVS